MKARVNTFLNIRTGTPEILPDNNTGNLFFKPGDVIEIAEAVRGDKYKDNDIWYKLDDGTFVWSGGVDKAEITVTRDLRKEVLATTPQLFQFDSAKMSWAHQFYDLPFVWKDLQTAGKDATVAVIDTGIDSSNTDLKNRIHPSSKSFVAQANTLLDENGHGTRMAGIIAASGSDKVYGVAPEAKLLILKGSIHMSGVNLDEFAKAINFASSIPEVDIVSISYSFTESLANQHPAFEQAIVNCLNSKKIIVAAIGNGHISDPDLPTFPACYNKAFPDKTGIVAIGAFNEAGMLCNFSNRSKHLRCLAPGDNILTTGLGNIKTSDVGSSIATAFTSACLALLVSYSKSQNQNIENCVPAILNNCDDIGSGIGFDTGTGYGRINLRNAIAKIKNTLT